MIRLGIPLSELGFIGLTDYRILFDKKIFIKIKQGAKYVCKLFRRRYGHGHAGCLPDAGASIPLSDTDSLPEYGHAAHGASANDITKASDFHDAGA